MITEKKTLVSKRVENKKILVAREFDASLEQVWKAWTERELLDQWWAPRPWKAETKNMNFTEGGIWLYCMVGPEGERHWCRVDFKSIQKNKSFTSVANFCDENGNINEDFPSMHWKNDFSKTSTGTKLEIEISFEKQADFEKILEMGFEQGFTMALVNLDGLLAK